MVQPKISIIVPVYKAEDYLSRCVDSLLEQTFQNYEILLIDDGSPDRSGEICDEYAKKDNRIKVIHKENGGVSSARQCGLDNAVGEYVIHADPDDWVESDMLEELYLKAKEEDADMVICDYYTNKFNLQKYIKQTPTSVESYSVLNDLFGHLYGCCWNKLMKRSFYNGICFPRDINFCEDLIFCISVLKRGPIITYLPKAFYHYSIDIENSLVKKVNTEILEMDLKLFYLINKLLDDDSLLIANFCKSFSMVILGRAFSSNTLSSTKFKEKYNFLKDEIFANQSTSLLFKIICYMSCIGFYKIMYQSYILMKLLRNFFNKMICRN